MIFSSSKDMLHQARRRRYAVGSFACRYPSMARAVLETAEEERSPVILSISQLELDWFALTPDAFIASVVEEADRAGVTVPVAVHLDHSWDKKVIEQAVACGFGSVLYDASARPMYENLAKTREIADMCHSDGVLVEAELGTGAAERVGFDRNRLLTVPDEAERFVKGAKCDCLAVSVGSSHGCYRLDDPAVDFSLLRELANRLPVPLALHGAESLPVGQVRQAVGEASGGISKVNFGTEMEMVMLEVLGLRERLTVRQAAELTRKDIDRVLPAVKALVQVTMREWLMSAGKAPGSDDGEPYFD
ncbi:MAG: class II fructose-bisphosphate aldolase [Planctomycetes bacterium]|nr:class II fructose-bisphosphate aldolase [Planctomycetota bacterium]